MKLKRFLIVPFLMSSFLFGCGNNISQTDYKLIDVIYVDTDPDKMIYCVGETFDPTGMVVNAYYQDETEEVIVGWTYDNHSPLDNGDKTSAVVTITIEYQGYTTELDITVVDSYEGIGSLTGLVPVNKPLLQKEGQRFDPTGCTFNAVFDGQRGEKVYKFGDYINGNTYNQIKLTNNEVLTRNQKSVMVNYSQGMEYPLNVTIADTIEVENSKTEYKALEEPFDVSSLTIKPNIVNGGEEIKIDPSSLTYYDSIEGQLESDHCFTLNGEHQIVAKYSANFEIKFTILVKDGLDEIEPDQNANPDQSIIEFEDDSKVELIDNSERDVLASAATYTGDHQGLVRDLVTYPGEYAPSNGDFIRCVQPLDEFKIKFNSFGGKADLILRGSTNNVIPKEFIAKETKLSSILDINVNGIDVVIPEDAAFRGKTGKDESVDKGGDYLGRYLYCLWTEINLGTIDLKYGINEILITIKGNNPGHYDALKLNYEPYKSAFVGDGEKIKVEAEDLTLTGELKATADNALWPEAKSSNGKYVQSIAELDTMTYSFVAEKDGLISFEIAGASNYCPQNNSSTPAKSFDMYLQNIMQVTFNDEEIKINESLKFNGVEAEDQVNGDRRVLTSYQEVVVTRYKVKKGQKYDIKMLFTQSGDGLKYKHAYGGNAYGNYDYITLQYGEYKGV